MVQSSANDDFFSGIYKDIWRRLNPDKLSEKEVEFMERIAQLKSGDRIWDMMCGYGRHAIRLAEKGYRVTATDNLPAYISEIEMAALGRSLPIESILSHALTWEPPVNEYKLVVNMGNSLIFFPQEEIRLILSRTARSLINKGKFLLHIWSTVEIAIQTFVEESKFTDNGLEVKSLSSYQFFPSRLLTRMEMKDSFGHQEERDATDYLFTLDQWQQMLEDAGLRLLDAWSIPGRKNFALGDRQVYLVAEKVNP